MSEHYPGTNPDSGSGSEKKKKETKGGSRFEMPTTTPRQEIQRSAGYETLKFGEGLKPLGGESYKPETAPSKLDAELDPTLDQIEKDAKKMQSERYQEISAEELRARAAQDAAEQLAHHHRAMFEAETDDSKEDSDEDNDDEPVKKLDKPVAEATEISDQEHDAFNSIMRQNVPELETVVSGDELDVSEYNKAVAAAEAARTRQPAPESGPAVAGTVGAVEAAKDKGPVGPAEEHDPDRRSETDAAFATVAASPELADLASKKLPETSGLPLDEQSKAEAFREWVQNEHPELQSPEMAAASNPDEGFNEIVEHSLGGNTPGETRYFEQAPGELPVDMDAGQNQPPNYPPTAEGGAWGDSGDDPNLNRAFNRYYPPNPTILNNPWTPAGGLTNPNTWAAIGALQARNEMNNLKHTAREIGLAGAVGLLGLGLIADHLWARRRFKKQKRQIKELGKQQDRTAEALREEQADHMLTKHKLERVSAEQSTDVEHLSEQLHQHHATGVEQGIGAGFAAALIPGAEAPVSKPVRQVEQAPALQSQEMAWYKESNGDGGQQAEQGSDLQTAEFAGAAAALGAEKPKGSEKPAFNQEGTHEQLQNQYLDSAGVKNRSSSGADGGNVVSSDVSNYKFNTNYSQSVEQYGNHVQNDGKFNASYAKPAIAGVIVFVIVLIALFIFAR